MGFNIAIDGPAGAGKSTVAKNAAKKMNFIYVDTGAMYRSIGLYLIRNGIDIDNEEKVSASLPDITVTIGFNKGKQEIFLNGENVSSLIRTQEVGEAASKTSAYKAVRSHLLELQRALSRTANVLMDGRDIGTTVLPQADLKIFLTASPEVRAKRRFKELSEKNIPAVYEDILREINERDYRDTHREISPLKQAEDAVFLDTSDMTEDQVTDRIIALAEEKINGNCC